MAIKYPNVGDTSQDNDVVLTTSAGRVGIGTTSPAAITHIHKPVTGAGSRTAPSGGLILSRYINGSDYRASSIFHSYRENGGGDFEYMAFAVAGYQSGSPYDSSKVKMVLDESGKVGIGVTDPDRKLEILDGGGNAQLKLSFDGTDNTELKVDTNGDLTITPSGTKVSVVGNLYATGSIIGGNGSDLGSSSNKYANLFMSSNLNYYNDLVFQASGSTEKMRLTTGGYLGIGINPTQKLHLAETNDNCSLVVDTYDDGAYCSEIWLRKSDTDTIGSLASTDNLNLLGKIGFFGVDAAGTPNWDETSLIQVQQRGAAGSYGVPSRMEFHTSNGVDGLELRMIIGEQGFVGIDVDPPSEILDVNGRLRLRDAGATSPNNNGTIWYDNTAGALKVRLGGSVYTIDVTAV